MAIQYRRAEEKDIDSLYELISYYAEKAIMLPRSKPLLQRTLDTFIVAIDDEQDRLVGCGSLCKLGEDLVEIRSLGVSDAYKGRGIGSEMVMHLEKEARLLKYPKLMALTYEAKFFQRNGFQIVDKDIFPEKVWKDCIYCTKQHCCDEIAVLKRLDLIELT